MTDPTDDLLRRLAEADPVDPATLPTADAPDARRLLENLMNETPHHAAGAAGDPSAQLDGHGIGADPVIQPMAAQADPGPRGFGRGRGMLIAAAAAVLILFGGLLVFSPDNTDSAVATVHSAAAAAADADTGRITTTFRLEAEGEQPVERVEGRLEASYAGSDIAVNLQIDDHAGQVPLDDLPVSDARLVDDVLYIHTGDLGGQGGGDGWLAVDTDGLLGSVVSDFVDPRVVLETVQELTEAIEVGSATIAGVETTHFQSVVDLGDETLSQSGWLGFEGVPIEADGEVTVDMFVDDTGLLTRLDLTGDVRDTSGSGESGTFDVTMDFHDIGADITVEAPADAEIVSPFDGLFEED